MLDGMIRVLKDDSGQGMAEYGLIIALIAVIVILALGLLGTNIRDKFDQVAQEIGNASP